MAQKQQGTSQGQNMNSGDMNQSQQRGTGQDRPDQSQQSGGTQGGQQGGNQQRQPGQQQQDNGTDRQRSDSDRNDQRR